MKHRITSAAIILTMLTALLVSCGDKTPSENNTNQITDSTPPRQDESPFVADSIPNDLDYNGADVKIMVGDYSGAYIDDLYSAEETGNRLSDTIYRTIQNVQERLNVNLVYNYETYTWGDMSAFQSKIISTILAADNEIDLLFDCQTYIPQMLEGEYFTNLADNKYVDLDKPWYNQTVRQNLANDYIHFASGQFSLANVKNVYCLYYNDDLYKTLGGTENLYEIVDSGKWTLDKLEELSKGTYADLNGDTTAGPEDRYGITFGDWNKYLGFQKAFDVSVFVKTKDGYEFTFDSERAYETIERLCSLVNDNENTLKAYINNDKSPDFQVSTGGGNYASKPFIEGRALFSFGLIADASTIVPTIGFSYGLLPYPKFDEEQENYQNLLQRNCYAMIPATAGDADLSGAVLEALSSESYRSLVPEYCEVTLKTRYSQDDDVSRMFDIIINSIVYDPGEIYSGQLGAPTTKFREAIWNNNPNWMSTVAAIKDSCIQKMDDIVNYNK